MTLTSLQDEAITAVAAVPAVTVKIRRRRPRRSWAAWLLLAPYVILLIVFAVGPTISAIGQSFVIKNIYTVGTQVGITNYAKVISDYRFLPAVGHVLTFLAIWLPIMTIGTIFFALLLHERANRFGGVMRFIYFLPTVVSGASAVVLWYFMLQPTLSPFGPVLKALGFASSTDVFASGNLAWIFALIAFMTGAGGWIVIMYGALQSIPQDMLEAAKIDGAGPIRTAISIKLPNIGKYIVYMLILSYSAGLQIFTEPLLIGTATAAKADSWSINQLSYAFAFAQTDFGSASAISVILIVVSGIGALILIYRTKFFERAVD